MKTNKLLSLCAILCTSAQLMAQVTITNPNVNPLIGKQYVVGQSTKEINAGNSGANQTWDLSSLTADSVVTWTSKTPQNETAIGSANFVFQNDNGTTSTSIKNSQSVWQVAGVIANNITFTYTDMEDLLRYPMNYNDTYTDPWACSFSNNGSVFYRKGTTTSTVDGYGTLKLPDNKTYSNVLRVHYVQNYTDSTNIGGVFPYVITTTNDEYMWYVQGIEYSLATASTLNITTTSTATSYLSSYLISNTEKTGVNNAVKDKNSVSISPNPASTYFVVKTIGKALVSVVSTNGTTVLQQEIEGQESISVSNLPKGFYLVKIQGDSETKVEKLIIK